jgi:inhibitor of cysteine peptidase
MRGRLAHVVALRVILIASSVLGDCLARPVACGSAVRGIQAVVRATRGASERIVRGDQARSSMTLTHADNGTAVTIRPGEHVVIRLAEHPTTGFRWAVDQGDEAIVALRENTYSPAAGARVGGDGQHVWTFEAQHTGTVQLRFKLWRAWEGDKSVQERFEITIHVTN